MTSPAIPPYSSTTIAMWNLPACISRIQLGDGLGLGHEVGRADEVGDRLAWPRPSRSTRIRSLM